METTRIQAERLLRDAVSNENSFESLCQELDSMPNFSCECESLIPFRSIECFSVSDVCSPCACGQFHLQLEFLGPDMVQVESCVSYTKGEYTDGCFTLVYHGEKFPSVCRLAFLDDTQSGRQLRDCERCDVCAVDKFVSIHTTCQNTQPLATTSSCTPVQLEGIFPGFSDGDCDDLMIPSRAIVPKLPKVVASSLLWLFLFARG